MNEVTLEGRLSQPAEARTLPSGDEVVTWRLVVPRAQPQGRTTVDTIDCAAWTAGLRRSALRWAAGTELRVEGSLQRRFWRSPTGAASRVEVQVRSARRA